MWKSQLCAWQAETNSKRWNIPTHHDIQQESAPQQESDNQQKVGSSSHDAQEFKDKNVPKWFWVCCF